MNILIEINSVIPVEKYGGTQRVAYCLGEELCKMGHKVTFLANKGSFCSFAKIIERDPQKPIENQIPENIDIVHFSNFAPENFQKPYILTIHGNEQDSCEFPINTVFVSENQAKRYHSDQFVYNGLNWNNYGKADLNKKRTLFHFLGKAAWRIKNVKGAIGIIKHLPNEHLEVLGGTRLNFKMGFRFTLSSRIHFHGLVDDKAKKEIIEQSKGLIFPVLWHEPFGLSIIESLYFGSPVFGTPYGSLSELVPENCGFLSNNMQELTEHIKHHSKEYSAKICNEYAAELFSSNKMAKMYLKKYETVLNGENLNATPPYSTGENFKNLPWITK